MRADYFHLVWLVSSISNNVYCEAAGDFHAITTLFGLLQITGCFFLGFYKFFLELDRCNSR